MTQTSAGVATAPLAQAATSRSRPRGSRRSAKRRRDTLIGYLFISPAIIGLFLFVGYPMVTSLYHSFTDWNGLTP